MVDSLIPVSPHPASFFITTAIDYTNGAPHIGHAYEKVLADVIARYHRLKGDHVFFLTGVDQHGQKVQQSAEKQGVAPQEFVDSVTAKFLALWKKLGVEYDGWAATTDERHKQCVRAILQRLWDEKDPATGRSRWIYKASQGGYYSVRQEQFLTDKERGPDGEFGPEWGEVEFREEENYYFRLAEHKQWLLDLIQKRSAGGNALVIPEFRVAELRNAVEKIEGDLCITRPKARLSWGIEVPFDPSFVTFVWFDALVNYISFAPGYDPRAASRDSEFQALWPAVHVIGKDILIPAHGIYWPIMLKALGFTDDEMPTFLVHGWWNIAGSKMSKSLGNVVDPDLLADKYGAEALRYYLMSDITTGRDADFSEERLVLRYNTDLANSLGNLLNRSLSMAWKYRGGIIKNRPVMKWGDVLEADLDLPEPVPPGRPQFGERFEGPSGIVNLGRSRNSLIKGVAGYSDNLGRRPFDVSAALSEVAKAVTGRNQMIDSAAPWKLAKDGGKQLQLDAVLYHLAESLRIVAILISPVLPNAAHGIFDQLVWRMDLAGSDKRFRLSDAEWGGEHGLPDDHQLGKPVPLFPRFEIPTE
jgi:methionyl-tRNA synthetase